MGSPARAYPENMRRSRARGGRVARILSRNEIKGQPAVPARKRRRVYETKSAPSRPQMKVEAAELDALIGALPYA